MSRPTVTIHGADGSPSENTHPLPNVFKAPIRPDIVQYEYIPERGDGDGTWLMQQQERAHWYGQEQKAAIRCEREGRSPDQC